MSQHDMNLANASGAAFRADANAALQAIAENNSGATEPSTTFSYQLWADTTTGLMKVRNAANSAWIILWVLATGAKTKGADIASASALAVLADGDFNDVTGTTGITSINALGVGTYKVLHFDDVVTLTHHATNLVLPSGNNITTAAGQILTFYEYASGDWRLISNSIPTSSTSTLIKNKIINGDMSIQQRIVQGTAFDSTSTPANNDDTYLLDRWLLLSDGNDIVDVSRETAGGVDGTDDYIRLDVETVSKKFGILQIIEGKNLKDVLDGSSTVSLSFEARVSNATKLSDIRAAVFAWDSTVDSVTSDIVSAWNAEGSIITPVANWTAENVATNLSVTTSWARFTIEGISVDTASAANLAVFIYQNNVATNDTTGIFLEITKVQLEEGSSANTYEQKSFAQELADCRRYCYVPCGSVVGALPATTIIGSGMTTSTTWGAFRIPLSVEMRTVDPSLTVTSAEWDWNGVDAAVIALNAGPVFNANTQGLSSNLELVVNAGGAGLTDNHLYFLQSDSTANRKMFFEAEL